MQTSSSSSSFSLVGRNPFLKRARKENEERVTTSSPPTDPIPRGDPPATGGETPSTISSSVIDSTQKDIESAEKTPAKPSDEIGFHHKSSLFSFHQHPENDLTKVWRTKRKYSKTKSISTKQNATNSNNNNDPNSHISESPILPAKEEAIPWLPLTSDETSPTKENSVKPQRIVTESRQNNEKRSKRFSPKKLSFIRNYLDTLKKLQDAQTAHMAEWGRNKMKQLIRELRNIPQDDNTTQSMDYVVRTGVEQGNEYSKEESDSILDLASHSASFSTVSRPLDSAWKEEENTDVVLETSFADLDAETIEKIAYFLQQQEHSLRYLRTQHVTQRRLLKAFLEDASEEKLENDDAFFRHIHQWISLSQFSTNNPWSFSPVEVESSFQQGMESSWFGSYDFAQHAMKEYILEYPQVFDVICPHGRKQQVAQRALFSYLAFNPLANGIGARQKVVEYYRKYLVSTGQQSSNDNPSNYKIRMEHLLEQAMEQRASHKKQQSVFIPYAKDRIPFDDEQVAKEWCVKVLMDKRKPEHEIPSVSYLGQLVENAKQHSPHMYSWYEDFHCRIRECCLEDMSETQLFLSCLATCSPNSSLSQNMINAMLNFRALSQAKRPRWGPYPMRSLLNYLAGALGRPSGHKVRAFLENLLFPLESKSVTIDTHMQKIALGIGRLSLSPLEYAVLEDYFRFVSDKISEALPHRLQSSLWSVIAGNMDYCSELENYRKRVICELPCEIDSDARNTLLLHLRRVLLDLGYLTRQDSKEDENKAIISFFLYVPLRRETVKSLKGHIALRRTFARKQQRQLLAQEEQEIAEYERAIEYCMSRKEAEEEQLHIDNPSDLKWFYRDWCQMESYCEPVKLRWDEEDKSTSLGWITASPMMSFVHQDDGWLEHEDPYFGSHQYFDGCRDLQVVLEPNGLDKYLGNVFCRAE